MASLKFFFSGVVDIISFTYMHVKDIDYVEVSSDFCKLNGSWQKCHGWRWEGGGWSVRFAGGGDGVGGKCEDRVFGVGVWAWGEG